MRQIATELLKEKTDGNEQPCITIAERAEIGLKVTNTVEEDPLGQWDVQYYGSNVITKEQRLVLPSGIPWGAWGQSSNTDVAFLATPTRTKKSSYQNLSAYLGPLSSSARHPQGRYYQLESPGIPLSKYPGMIV